MIKRHFAITLFATALTLALSSPASAAAIVTITPGPMSPVAGVTNFSFDSGSLPSNFAAAGPNAGVVSGSSPGLYSAPAGDATPFAFVGPGSSITATFSPGGVTYVGLYWGSADPYNSLALKDSSGVTTTYGQGGTSIPGLAGSEYVNISSTGAEFVSATFTSSQFAFEFDNVATATPEPTSGSLIGGGILLVGWNVMRRRKSLS